MGLGLIGQEKVGFEKVTKVTGLTSILKSRLPKSCNVYNMVQNYHKFQNEMSFYILNPKMSNSSHWIIATYLREDRGMDVNISGPSDMSGVSEFKEALIYSGVIKWNEPFIFAAIDIQLSTLIQEITFQATGKYPKTCENIMYYTTSLKNVADFHVSNDSVVELKPLDSQEGAQFLVSNWKFATTGSLSYIRKLIERNGGAGVFVDGKLATGITLNGSGMMTMLHTLDEYRHRGFAKMCMTYFVEVLLKENLIPCCTVEASNLPSISLQLKTGLERINDTVYINVI